jgi:hypothetical protein
MNTPKLLQDTIDFHAPAGTGDPAVLHRALVFFLRHQLGATALPIAPNLQEQRKMLPLLEGFAKAMMICAAGDGTLAGEELDYVLGFVANSGGTYELIEELRALDITKLDPLELLEKTERPGLFVHALIFHAIKASDADGVLDEREEQTIRAMAMMLGVSPGEVERLFALHEEEKEFLRRKMETMFPSGHPWG